MYLKKNTFTCFVGAQSSRWTGNYTKWNFRKTACKFTTHGTGSTIVCVSRHQLNAIVLVVYQNFSDFCIRTARVNLPHHNIIYMYP